MPLLPDPRPRAVDGVTKMAHGEPCDAACTGESNAAPGVDGSAAGRDGAPTAGESALRTSYSADDGVTMASRCAQHKHPPQNAGTRRARDRMPLPCPTARRCPYGQQRSPAAPQPCHLRPRRCPRAPPQQRARASSPPRDEEAWPVDTNVGFSPHKPAGDPFLIVGPAHNQKYYRESYDLRSPSVDHGMLHCLDLVFEDKPM